MRGVGDEPRNADFAGAEVVDVAEGYMCGAVMRGTDALPGSKATSRMKGTGRNVGDLATGRPGYARAVRIGKARSRSR